MDAFRDHGEPAETVARGVEEAAALMDDLAASGVSMDHVTAGLEREGVQLFADSFRALVVALDEKVAGLGSRDA